MFLKHIFLGIVVKAVASFDDTLTRIPIIASITRTRIGKVAFSIGNLLAISTAILLAIGFSSVISSFPYAREITAVLIFILASAVYFNVFVAKKESATEQKLKQITGITRKRFFKLIGIGYLITLATLLDDIIVLTPLFLGSRLASLYATIGIYLITLVQIIIVIYFAEKVDKIKYKKEIASSALIILGVLILFGVI